MLGIGNKVSPLVRCLVTEAATQAPSFEQARPRVGWLGLNFSASRIRRISEDFCKVALMVRAQRLAELASIPTSQVLKGRRVALAVDGAVRCDEPFDVVVNEKVAGQVMKVRMRAKVVDNLCV